MKIVVKAFANLKDAMGSKRELELNDGCTIRDMIKMLASDEKNVRTALLNDDGDLKEYISIMINRRMTKTTSGLMYMLNDGDEVAFLPPLSGG